MLTFEKIRELYDKERGNAKLQPMPEDFLLEATEYLKGSDETIKKVINSLLDRRQQKLVDMAIMSTKTSIVSKPANIMAHEECAFAQMVEILKSLRSFGNGKPFVRESPQKPEASTEIQKTAPADNEKQITCAQPAEQQKDGFCLITQSIPSFIGTDMKTYCLKKGDKVYLPKELREFLEKSGVCERLN